MLNPQPRGRPNDVWTIQDVRNGADRDPRQGGDVLDSRTTHLSSSRGIVAPRTIPPAARRERDTRERHPASSADDTPRPRSPDSLKRFRVGIVVGRNDSSLTPKGVDTSSCRRTFSSGSRNRRSKCHRGHTETTEPVQVVRPGGRSARSVRQAGRRRPGAFVDRARAARGVAHPVGRGRIRRTGRARRVIAVAERTRHRRRPNTMLTRGDVHVEASSTPPSTFDAGRPCRGVGDVIPWRRSGADLSGLSATIDREPGCGYSGWSGSAPVRRSWVTRPMLGAEPRTDRSQPMPSFADSDVVVGIEPHRWCPPRRSYEAHLARRRHRTRSRPCVQPHQRRTPPS